MKQCVPDWSMEDEMRSFHDLLSCSNQKKPMSPENDLVELLWRNGHVVMQSQSNRKPPQLNTNEFKHTTTLQKPTVPLVNPSNLIQEEEEEEAAAWFQYTLDDGSLDKEFCSELLFCDMPIANATNYDTCNKPNKEVARVAAANQHSNNAFMMVAPPPPPPPKLGNGGGGPLNFSHFSRPMKKPGVVVGESSSACGTNQAVQNQVAYVKNQTLSNEATGLLVGNKLGKDGGNNKVISLQEGVRTSTFDATTMTSSSGGSGCSYGRTTGQQSTSNHNDKRKGRDAEDSECPSEEAEYESVEANRPTKRAASTRKSRAAEVHNLSERRRRDRINEKMKALQELIPHCNKSDKASMLDEAIEYLKSLQLQLQLMWMGSGMAPMMFPGMQQCMSRVNVGMGHAPMTSINNPIQLSRAPLINHSLPSTTPTNQMTMCPPSQTVNPISLTPQMQNVPHPESYARYFGFPHMQMPPQTMNLYTYGSHMMTQNQTGAMPGSSSLPTAGIPPENIQNGQSDRLNAR